LREYREYERTSTTVLNAYVGPRVSRYLDDLERLLEASGFKGQFLIMQSNGGSMSPATAKKIRSRPWSRGRSAHHRGGRMYA